MAALRVETLTAAYPGRVAVRGVSFAAEPGAIVGLIGPNGSGKTSLLRAIAGTIAPAHGTVHLGDVDLARLGAAERARLIATVPQGTRMPEGFSVGEVVLMGRSPHLPPLAAEGPRDFQIAQQAMAAAAVAEFAERRIGELSGGEQQRVLIARALAQQPHVLLLDEATAHLDLRHQTALMAVTRRLARDGLIVIAALHDLNLAAQYADRLLLLHNGALLAHGSPADVLTPARLHEAYGVATVIGAHPRYGTPVVSLVEDQDDVTTL
jgi:iron complex transport system ATP-binding protein